MTEYDPRDFVAVSRKPSFPEIPPSTAQDALKYHAVAFAREASHIRERISEMTRLMDACQKAIDEDTVLADSFEAEAEKLFGLGLR